VHRNKPQYDVSEEVKTAGNAGLVALSYHYVRATGHKSAAQLGQTT
jgi:hypothetical protein